MYVSSVNKSGVSATNFASKVFLDTFSLIITHVHRRAGTEKGEIGSKFKSKQMMGPLRVEYSIFTTSTSSTLSTAHHLLLMDYLKRILLKVFFLFTLQHDNRRKGKHFVALTYDVSNR